MSSKMMSIFWVFFHGARLTKPQRSKSLLIGEKPVHHDPFIVILMVDIYIYIFK